MGPELKSIVEVVESHHNTLSDKQKLLIYLALMRPRPKARALHDDLRSMLAATSEDLVRRGPQGIVGRLEEILRSWKI